MACSILEKGNKTKKNWSILSIAENNVIFCIREN